jgi:hypothetical protein
MSDVQAEPGDSGEEGGGVELKAAGRADGEPPTAITGQRQQASSEREDNAPANQADSVNGCPEPRARTLRLNARAYLLFRIAVCSHAPGKLTDARPTCRFEYA